MNIPKLELKTDREIQQLAYTVLIRELGIVGFIQLTVNSIVQMIQEDNEHVLQKTSE